MKLSCTPISFKQAFSRGGMDMERFIDFCAEQELDGVDLMAPVFYGWSWKSPESELQAAPRLIERAGLKLAAYAAGNNFTKHDGAELAEQVKLVKQVIAEAADIGAPAVRIFGGYIEETGGEKGMTPSIALGKIIRGIAECLPTAEEQGITLALENHGRMPGHSYEAEAIIRHFDSAYLRLTADCGNFMGNNMDEFENPVAAVERIAPWVGHVHMKDVRKPVMNKERRMEACVTGDGEVPVRQCAAVLEKAGFDGYCSLEYEADALVPAEEGVPKSLAYLREVRNMLAVLYGNAH